MCMPCVCPTRYHPQAAQEADLLDCYRVLQAQIAEEEADSSPTSSATSSTSSGSSPATPAFLSTHPEQRARRRRLATRLQELLSGLRDATRGRVWRAAALYRPYVQLAELLQSCGVGTAGRTDRTVQAAPCRTGLAAFRIEFCRLASFLCTQ